MSETVTLMPWDNLTETETKTLSKVIESVKEQDFSSKSLKHWTAFYSNIFD